AQVQSFDIKSKAGSTGRREAKPPAAAGAGGAGAQPPAEAFTRIPVEIALAIPATKVTSYVNALLTLPHITFEVRHLELSKIFENLKIKVIEPIQEAEAKAKSDGLIAEPPVKLVLELDALDWNEEEPRP
ncbi:MAG: hypothetical protein L0Z55_03825, partial [Planctomycetes bacterium]|nr:hypothetical protein [Planctomycetota bacterium]